MPVPGTSRAYHRPVIEFPGMPHLLMVAPGWERVAEYVAEWLHDVLPKA